MKDFSFLKLLNTIILKPFYWFVVFIISIILLYGKDSLSKRLGVEDIQLKYYPFIGLVALVSGVLCFCHAVRCAYRSVLKKYSSYKYKHRVINQLNYLSDSEKLILFYCIYNNIQTIFAPVGNSILQSLCSKGLIIQSGGVGEALNWPYSIVDWVWIYLKKHNGVLFSNFVKVNINELKQKLNDILYPSPF